MHEVRRRLRFRWREISPTQMRLIVRGIFRRLSPEVERATDRSLDAFLPARLQKRSGTFPASSPTRSLRRLFEVPSA